MEKADPLIMLIGLPAIPVMLMLGRLIRWEDAVLKFWRKHSTKFPLFNIIFPNGIVFIYEIKRIKKILKYFINYMKI